MNDWIKRWLFTLSLSMALLIPISVWLAEALAWFLFQRPWDLPIGIFELLIVVVVVLVFIALMAIINQPTQRKPWKKTQHSVLLIITMAFNVICWWVIWLISYGYVT